MRLLVLGASGMLGHAVFRRFTADPAFQVVGTVRAAPTFQPDGGALLRGVDVDDDAQISAAFKEAAPDVVINCVGVIKQLKTAQDPLPCIRLNSLLPHRLNALCAASDARLVHISTDCVFTGSKGDYLESDVCDADDLYGRSKLLGEVDTPGAITLRTSIIGHELANGATGLVGWFLSQKGAVKGFRNAIFSGLPTVALADVIARHVLPAPELSGVYHVSAAPISKYDLLNLVAEVYGRDNDITPVDEPRIDRSLNSQRFRDATGYAPPAWPDLVAQMHAFG